MGLCSRFWDFVLERWTDGLQESGRGKTQELSVTFFDT